MRNLAVDKFSKWHSITELLHVPLRFKPSQTQLEFKLFGTDVLTALTGITQHQHSLRGGCRQGCVSRYRFPHLGPFRQDLGQGASLPESSGCTFQGHSSLRRDESLVSSRVINSTRNQILYLALTHGARLT